MFVGHRVSRACGVLAGMVCAVSSAATIAVAQHAPGVTFGILFGGTSSHVTDLNTASPDLFNGTGQVANRYGVRAGVFVNQPIGHALSLQPEVYFIQKGTRLHATPSSSGSLDLGLSYIEIPLLLRYDLAPTSAWRPFVAAGPSFGFRVYCKGLFRYGTQAQSANCRELNDDPAKDLFVSSDAGMSAGVGIAHDVAGHSVLLQARYGRGFTTIVTNPSAGIAPKNSTLSLVAGVGFGR